MCRSRPQTSQTSSCTRGIRVHARMPIVRRPSPLVSDIIMQRRTNYFTTIAAVAVSAVAVLAVVRTRCNSETSADNALLGQPITAAPADERPVLEVEEDDVKSSVLASIRDLGIRSDSSVRSLERQTALMYNAYFSSDMSSFQEAHLEAGLEFDPGWTTDRGQSIFNYRTITTNGAAVDADQVRFSYIIRSGNRLKSDTPEIAEFAGSGYAIETIGKPRGPNDVVDREQNDIDVVEVVLPGTYHKTSSAGTFDGTLKIQFATRSGSDVWIPVAVYVEYGNDLGEPGVNLPPLAWYE